MANLLYLVHRFPYPPNKGDKVRSYHLLRHLAARHRVHLGTLIDDPADLAHLETVRALCASLHVGRLHPRAARVRSLAGLLRGEALTLAYYRDAALLRWVRATVAREPLDGAVIFSSAMAQYVDAGRLPMLVDFVDVDSAKWTQYAPNHRWPLSWLYRREGERLLAFERSVARDAQRSFFVTEAEAALFRSQAPESAAQVEAIGNGVDSDFFAPDAARPSPYDAAGPAVVFTGAMDYWPNVDAVQWFATAMLPALRERWPTLRFFIVGRSPTPDVLALASAHVVVTGTVDDVRPYLQHAAVVVAPLRVARGIQNKILEAMAMGRPVVAAAGCVAPMDVAAGTDVLAAGDEAAYIAQVDACLRAPEQAQAVGAAGRACVVQRYSWAAHLSRIDKPIASLGGRAAPRAPAPVEAGA